MRRRWLAWPFLVSALLLCGLATRAAGAQGTIAAIEITGHRTVEPETIRTRLQFAKGSAYDPAKVDQSIKALFATGIFSDVRIERRGTTVYVRVVENPIVSAVSFEGQRAIDTDIAHRLAHYFGMSERYWLDLQARYDGRGEEKHSQRITTGQSLRYAG